MKHALIGYKWKPDRTEEQWLFWLKQKLQAQGFLVTVSSISSWPGKPSSWIQTLKEQHRVDEANIHLVKNDPGCLTLLSYLEKLARTPTIEAAMLVAGSGTRSLSSNNRPTSPPPYYYLPGNQQIAPHQAQVPMLFSNESIDSMNASIVVLYSTLQELPHTALQLEQ